MSRLFSTIAIMATLILPTLAGCSNREKQAPAEFENAVYHWKNYMNLSDTESEFLYSHHINRMYVRLFDVRPDYRYGCVPDAEAYLVLDNIPAGTKIVPTVFITLEALKEMNGKEEELANNIYQRVVDMLKAYDITDFDELQIDCDWTPSTQDSFFNFCKNLGGVAHKDKRLLSATIRLHQLSLLAPPVDSGVLMVYNVGDLQDPNETNSILRSDIVKKYLKSAPKYPLKLDVAYPLFSWGVVFKGDRFNRLVRITTPIDSIGGLKPVHDNLYEVTNSKPNEDVLSGDCHETFRYESVSAESIMEVKRLVENYLGGRPHRIILYHLDDSTIGNYTPSQIDSIYG